MDLLGRSGRVDLGGLSMLLLALAAVAHAAPPLHVLEEALPTTLNPLYAANEIDNRTQQLVFDRLFFRAAIT